VFLLSRRSARALVEPGPDQFLISLTEDGAGGGCIKLEDAFCEHLQPSAGPELLPPRGDGVQNADRGIDKGLKANFCRLLADANEQSMIVIRSKTNVGSKNGGIEQDVAAD